MDERQELEQLRKRKRLAVLEAKAAGTPPATSEQPVHESFGEKLVKDYNKSPTGAHLLDNFNPMPPGAAVGSTALRRLLGSSAAGAAGGAMHPAEDAPERVWNTVKGGVGGALMSAGDGYSAIKDGGKTMYQGGAKFLNTGIKALPEGTKDAIAVASPRLHHLLKGIERVASRAEGEAALASNGSRNVPVSERSLNNTPKLEPVPEGMAPRTRPVPSEPIPVEAPISVEPIPAGPAPRTGSAPREVPVESPVLSGDAQYAVSRTTPEPFSPAATVKPEPMSLADALSIHAPELSKAGRAPIGKPANLPRSAMSMDQVPPMIKGESLMDYFNRINQVGSDIIAPIKK